MIDVLSYFEERKEEFERHLSIARMLQARLNDFGEETDFLIEVRHVNTIKSGLLIHLYNIVEAIFTRTLEEVSKSILHEKPSRWTEAVLNEWVRAEVWNGEDRIGEGAVKRLAKISSALASGNNLQFFTIKGTPGSWDDTSIKKISHRLGCALTLSSKVKRGAYETIYKNETTALQYLAKRRNAIAHGSSTFEDGANDLTLEDLSDLADRVLPFLKEVIASYQSYLTNKGFVIAEVTAE